jgi:hypothetical protein
MIKAWKERSVSYKVHQEVLTASGIIKDENKDLKAQNKLLEKIIKQRNDEIAYLNEEKTIDQKFIADLLGKILKYTLVPESEVNALETGVTVAKALARKNYGRR